MNVLNMYRCVRWARRESIRNDIEQELIEDRAFGIGAYLKIIDLCQHWSKAITSRTQKPFRQEGAREREGAFLFFSFSLCRSISSRSFIHCDNARRVVVAAAVLRFDE